MYQPRCPYCRKLTSCPRHGYRPLLVFVLLSLLLLLQPGCRIVSVPPTPPPCTAQHSWENYHLPHHALEPVIRNESSFAVDLAVWNELDTPLTLRSVGVGYEIQIQDGGDANSSWLGLATVRVDNEDHIHSPRVQMNAIKLAGYSATVAAHVACQELGHELGLDHQRLVDDSCMDDCQGRDSRTAWLACLENPRAVGPNAHDAQQLRQIYAHAVDDPPSPPPPPNCVGTTTLHAFEEVKE